MNQHPKKPHQSKIDELTIPYHWQAAETAKIIEKKNYSPEADGKKDFVKKVKGVTTFSDNKFFKTVFVSGDDMVAEEKALKAKEHADWEKRIIVESKNFAVNTKPLHS